MSEKFCSKCKTLKDTKDFPQSHCWCHTCNNDFKTQNRHKPLRKPLAAYAARFWSKVDKNPSNPEGCWLWTAGILRKGYGSFSVEYKTIQASRMSYILTYGPISDDLVVRHKCHNPPCCRPEHLCIGTDKDNSDDAAIIGKFLRKFSELEIQYIYSVRWEMPCKVLAAQFNVSINAIYDIWHRRTHLHLLPVIDSEFPEQTSSSNLESSGSV